MDNEIEIKPLDTKGALVGRKLTGMKIEVTPEIISTALPKESGHCMISDAVHTAAAKKGWKISKVLTDLQTVRFTDLETKRRYICFTPREGQVALLQFDQGIKPEPFHFRLKPVQIIEKQHRARKAKAGEPGTGASKPRLALRATNGGGYTRPIKHGGRALVTSVGQRREFGLRGMGAYITEEGTPESQ